MYRKGYDKKTSKLNKVGGNYQLLKIGYRKDKIKKKTNIKKKRGGIYIKHWTRSKVAKRAKYTRNKVKKGEIKRVETLKLDQNVRKKGQANHNGTLESEIEYKDKKKLI